MISIKRQLDTSELEGGSSIEEAIKSASTILITDLGKSREEDRSYFTGICFKNHLRRSGALKRAHLKIHFQEGEEFCFAVSFCMIGEKNNGEEFYLLLGAEMIHQLFFSFRTFFSTL